MKKIIKNSKIFSFCFFSTDPITCVRSNCVDTCIVFQAIMGKLEFTFIYITTSSVCEHLITNLTIAIKTSVNVNAKLIIISVLVANCKILTFINICAAKSRNTFVAFYTPTNSFRIFQNTKSVIFTFWFAFIRTVKRTNCIFAKRDVPTIVFRIIWITFVNILIRISNLRNRLSLLKC